jgi:hypothetical protein
MPVATTLASLSKNGLSNTGSTPTYENWMSVIGKFSGTLSSMDYVDTYNDKLVINYWTSGTGPTWINLSSTTGLPIYNTKYSGAFTGNLLLASTIDPSGNTHTLRKNTLLMYSDTQGFVRGVTFTVSGNISTNARVFSDSSYVYITYSYTTTFRIIKVRISDYAIMWANTYTTGVTMSADFNNPFKLLFHSGGDLILVGYGSKTFFYLRIGTGGSIVWQKKYTTAGSVSVGPGNGCVLDSSDNLFVMNTFTSFSNILIKIDTSNGNLLDERTLSTTSTFYQCMEIYNDKLYLASFAIGAPGTDISLAVIDTSFNSLQNHNINDANGMQLGGIALTSTNCYIYYQLDDPSSGNGSPVILKLPLDTALTTSTDYSIPLGTYRLNGTLAITSLSNVTLTATFIITLSPGTVTYASTSITSASATDPRAAETTIKYINSI